MHPPSSWYGYTYRCLVNNNIFTSYNVLKIENVWTGNVSNQWEKPANWTCGVVPDANTDVIINSGTVLVNSNITVRTLRVMPGSNVTVNSGFAITILH